MKMENSDVEQIKLLIPFNEKSKAEINACLKNARISIFSAGKMIFKRDEKDENIYWLLSGAIDLLDEKFEAKHRKAEDTTAEYPIDNNNPHLLTAISTKKTRVLVLARSEIGLAALNSPNLSPQPVPDTANSKTNSDKENRNEEKIDWMSALLSSPLFEFIPPVNIQTLFSKFEELNFDKGDVVLKEGEPGDYFYVIHSGSVKVERKINGKDTLLARLNAGNNFGQDALISAVPRNATITMLSKGVLMRLSAPDFQSLLVHPVLETITLEETMEMYHQANPKTYILDVRTPKEFEADKLTGSQNVPLLHLINRKNLSKLKTEAIYVTHCDGSNRAELAAFLLNEHGFSAYVLKNSP
ncbi:MAG: cyclic nucleotide-binding domain-containing protein [Pseudomonadales bacterium]|nr:cyclic nucleotide-binding domain-containing protein [Pseudomonadales bacterium]